MRHFWETVATSISTQEAGGHVDIFLPLAETGKLKKGFSKYLISVLLRESAGI